MRRFNYLSISAKLTVLMTGVALASVLAGFAVLTAIDARSFRRELVQNVTLLARMYAEHCVADLAFGYQDDARQILERLSLDEEIDHAAIYGRDGKLFAAYSRAGSPPPPATFAVHRLEQDLGGVEISERMSYRGVTYGTFFVKASTAQLSRRIALKTKLLGALAVFIVFLSLLISLLAQRLVSAPILKLAELAGKVASAKDYSQRSGMERGDEIGVLAGGFDAMLAGLEASNRERDAAEEKLRKSEADKKATLQDLLAGVVIHAADTTIIYSNKAAQSILGLSEDQMLGKKAIDPEWRFVQEDLGKIELKDYPVNRAISGGVQFSDLTLGVQRPDREYVTWVNVSALPVYAEGGGLEKVIVNFADITRRKRAEEQLRQAHDTLEATVGARTAELKAANEELEAFTYSASHDLRAPIRRIDGFSALLEQECAAGLSATAKDYLARIRKGCARMGEVVDDLLKLSRIMRQESKFEKVDLSRLAGEEALRLSEAEPGRKVNFKAADGVCVTGDPGLLKEVVDNLLENAWKFTRKTEKPEVEFGAEQRGGEPVYFVKDNGKGFDMKFAGKLFHPFQRLHSADEFPGTGVGLNIVRRIVEYHGGKVWVEAAEDKGAAFYFTLKAGA